jgi:hypothetical protein
MTTLFREARLKIERAKKHINDLNVKARDFAKTRSHEVFIEHDPQGGDDILKVKAGLLPDEFALILGDAVHNLFAALDYTINEVEFLNTGRRSKYTKFPMYASRKLLAGAVGGDYEKKIPKPVIDCILDTVQPYPGGDNAILYGLYSIEMEDKHRLLIPKLELKFVEGITIENDAGIEIEIPLWLVVDTKVAQQPIKGCRNAKVKNHGKATVKIMFTDMIMVKLRGGPISGPAPLIPTLELMARRCEEIIAEIEYWFKLSQIRI